ncbi:unnamed protein product [Nezara viridula]|uniref:Uncharacterized protein n=1 Tax=Nezara viridula TaxID=85310 RepID=A0A9P0GXK8_NEZVI|nr:unnamed protein product [Nezara viridula]
MKGSRRRGKDQSFTSIKVEPRCYQNLKLGKTYVKHQDTGLQKRSLLAETTSTHITVLRKSPLNTTINTKIAFTAA